MHEHWLTDDDGETVDYVPLCSDSCHRMWCEQNDEPYGGWSGCHESCQDQWCAQCGVRCDLDAEGPCDGMCLPVVVNLVAPVDTRCPHDVPDCIAPVTA